MNKFNLFQNAFKFHQQGKFEKAKEIYQNILKNDQSNFEILHLLGLIEYQNKNYQIAINLILKAIKIYPESHIFHFNLGIIYKDSLDLKSATKSFENAIKFKNNYFESYFHIGLIKQSNGDLQGAINNYNNAIFINPKYVDAYYNLAIALKKNKNYEKAKEMYNKVISLDSRHVQSYYNLAIILKETGKLENAILNLDAAIRLKENFIEAHYNKGVMLHQLNRLEDSIMSYEKVISIYPDYQDAQWNLSLIYLFLSNFEKGWLKYESRWKVSSFDSQPYKSSKPLCSDLDKNQTLLLWNEQGIGDEILFSSMFLEISSYFKNLIILVDKRLLPLFERSMPNIKFVDKSIPNKNLIYDVHLPIGSIGKFIRGSKSKFANVKNEYLLSNPLIDSQINKNLQHKKQNIICGISWKSTNKTFGSHKSIGLKQIIKSFQKKNLSFMNLQYGDNQQEINELNKKNDNQILEYDKIDNFVNIDGLASLINNCEFVITTSNSTAHLAGALGKKTFLILPLNIGNMWYWGNTKDGQSLWYPSIKIFRQAKQGDWQDPLNQILEVLD